MSASLTEGLSILIPLSINKKFITYILHYNRLTVKFQVMKKIIFYSAVLIALALLPACAPVQIYSDSGMTKKSGLKIYTSKPYLQVERNAETGSIVKVDVVYLPDLSNPQYVAIKNGPGSRKFDIKVKDGCVTSFGYTSDTKIDDYIDALSALLSKGTYAVTNLDALKVPGVKAGDTGVELYEVVMEEGKTVLRRVEEEGSDQ
jgi:hypothetical protein